jgi:regulator of replication initiation timing
MNLINELSTLESELESLRSENKILRENKILLDFENDQLKRRLSNVEEQRDKNLAGKVRLKTILDQAGQHLVSGIQRYNEEMREAIGVVTEAPRMLERVAETPLPPQPTP